MGNLINSYLYKALDAYPYDLEETIESLNYALAYDDKNALALNLMARVYSEQLYNYEKSKEYFAEALAQNMNAFYVYPHYINVLLWNNDLDEAEKLIDFALTIKGIDRAVMYLKKGILFEQKQEYKKALKEIKTAKSYTYNDDFMNTLNSEKERIKGKLPKKRKNNKKKSKSKKKK